MGSSRFDDLADAGLRDPRRFGDLRIAASDGRCLRDVLAELGFGVARSFGEALATLGSVSDVFEGDVPQAGSPWTRRHDTHVRRTISLSRLAGLTLRVCRIWVTVIALSDSRLDDDHCRRLWWVVGAALPAGGGSTRQRAGRWKGVTVESKGTKDRGAGLVIALPYEAIHSLIAFRAESASRARASLPRRARRVGRRDLTRR